MKISKVVLIFLFSTIASAQNLTISSTGQTGTSGTNWSITGTTLTVTGTAKIRASVIVNALANGNLTVVGNSTNFAVTVSEAITATGNNTLTVGSATNTGTITFNAVTSFAGPVNLYGGSINMDQNMTCTSSGSPILLQSTGAIDIAASRTVQSNSGNITLRSNSGGTVLSGASSIILNSSSSLLSQGGNITLGGNFTGAQGAGLYATSGNAPAILISGGTISAAGGNIKLYGKCNVFYDDGIRLTGTINTTGTGTIELYGEAYGGLTGSDTYFGGVTFGTANTTVSTENGNLTIEGILTNTNSSSASGLNFYRVAGGNGSLSIQLLSKTGNIQVSGRKAPSAASYGIGQCSQGDVYIGSPKDNSWTATGNIIMSLSSFDLAASTGIIFKTIGALNVEPYDASFNSTLTFPFTNNSSISSVSAFTMGKASNTANITIGAPGISVAGPITLYGGALSLGANITSTAGGEIALYSDAALAGLSSARSMTTTGAFRYLPQGTSFSSTVTFPITNLSLVNITELQLGKSGNTAGITIESSATIAGPISIYGGYVNINGNLTSSATGDIFIKGIAGTNPSIWVQSGKTITKSGGTGTLTMQGHGRVSNSGSITTSGTGVLNVIFWSDFDNSNNDGGVSQFGTVSTNGGHVWLGGSNSNGGSYTWNELTVGDGPSIGTSGFNGNALDIQGHITTSGGDLLVWAGNGSGGGTNGIVTNAGWELNVSDGDVVFITPSVLGSGPSLLLRQNGGTFTLVPNGTSFPVALNWSPSDNVYSGMVNWNFPDEFNYLWIENPTTLTYLTVGRYDGMSSGGNPVVLLNTSNININLPTTIAGSMSFYGGALALNSNLTTTNATTGNITLSGTTISGTGNIALASGRNATLNVSATSTYDGVVSGTVSALTKSGSGKLMLTKDQTYSGVTTITAGDLQVGTGGSVDQASSGSISNTSAVAVASGSKLILTPNENILFAKPISGAGGVEIKGASGLYRGTALTTTASLIASNVSVLEVLTRITGGTFTGSAGSGNCGAYQKSYNAATNTATLQFQQFLSPYTKVVFVTLERINTTDVAIKGTGAAYRSGDYLGQNMATIGGTTAYTFPTNYGISQVFMSGKVNFTGALTYTGTTTLSNTTTSATSPTTYSYISKGTQEITDASSSFPSAIVNNGLVILNRTTPLTIAGDMSGTEDILQVGADVTFTGTNTHTGITTIDLNKSLLIGNGSTSGSITGNIINYGSLTFNRSDNSTYPGIISGSGSLTKLGEGSHTLTGLNTYAGATTITAGKLVLERDVPVTSSTGYSGSGTLVIQPASDSFTSAISYPIAGFTISNSIGGLTIGKATNSTNITFANATTVAGPITAYAGTITLNAGLTTTNNGAISFYSDNAIAGLSASRAVSSAGAFNYIPQSNSFSAAVTYPITNLNVSSTGLLIGKSTNTANLTFGATTTIAGPITAYGGTIAVNAALTATNSNINLTASTAATQTAAITANGLDLNGTGTFTLTNTSNNIATLSGGSSSSKLGSLSLVDASGGLAIGALTNTGITASGTISVATLNGDITLANNIQTDNTTTSAVIINAGQSRSIGDAIGGNIIVSGLTDISTGTNGITKLFSGREAESTGLTTFVNGATNVRLGVDETTSTFAPVLANNNKYALYRFNDATIGGITIVSSGGVTVNNGWEFVNNTIIPTTAAAISIDASVLQNYLLTNPLTVRAGSITFSANIVNSTANQLTLNSYTFIKNTAATTITTAGGNVVMASNTDDATDNDITTNGYIQFSSGLTMTTNGGNITLGGGDASASGYAIGTSAYPYEGLRVDGTLNINSGGGNIIMRGKSYAISTASGSWGMGFWNLSTGSITSGTGTITLDGFSQSSGGTHNSGLYTHGALTVTSANTTADAIKLIGKSTGASGQAWGIEAESALSVLTTEGGGGITISTSQQSSDTYDAVFRGVTNILAKSGPIKLLGKQNEGIANGKWHTGADFNLGSKASTTVPTSSSNILIQYDKFEFSGLRNIATIGTITFQPASTSFGQEFDTSWFSWNQNSQTMSGLTIGKPDNTSTITHQTNAITVAGPVSVYGGALAFNSVLTATNNNINLYASGAVTQTAALSANGLDLNGTGTYTLTNTSNAIATLSGGSSTSKLGSLSFVDASGGLTLGALTNTGITASGAISVATFNGDITLSNNIQTDSATSSAVIINAGQSRGLGDAQGGNILISGSPVITTGVNGITKLFSGREAESTGLTTFAGGTSNTRNGVDEITVTFSPVLASNNKYALYRYDATYFGNITIVNSGGAAINNGWEFVNNTIQPTSATAVSVNASVVNAYLIANPLTIRAGSITFNANVTGTNANNLSILSNTFINNSSATTITTQGGNVLFASNVDDATDGESTTNGTIQLRQGITINSNGGNITFGGGNTSGSDYSLGSSDIAYTEGVRFDGTIALNSGGGNIALRGKSYAMGVYLSYGASGVGFYAFSAATGTINSGTGTITIDGYSQTNTSSYASGIYSMDNMTITSANTTADAIRLIGKATGTSGEAWGIETENTFSVLATGEGGGITISSSQQIADNYDVFFRGETNILAKSGPIQLLGKQDGGVANGRWFNGNNFYLGSKALSAVPTSSSAITIQYDKYNFSGYTPKLATSGTLNWKPASASFGQNVGTDYFAWSQNSQTLSGLTIGKSGNAVIVYLNSAFTVAGPISVYGSYVEFTGNITSSADGDIFIKSVINGNNPSVYIGAVTINKSAGTGTLTFQSSGRVLNYGTLSATGTGRLNVVMWSDYDNTNDDGGVSHMGTISTNGGHVWMGGSNATSGSYTWNGLAVGDGPSIGSTNYNCHAMDLFGPITTGGGDVLLWASSPGCGTSGIVSDGTRLINAGSGNITLIAPQTSGAIELTSTGVISLVPNAGSYASALTLGGTLTTGNFTFNTSFYNGLKINSLANSGLVIGNYLGHLSGGTAVTQGNSSNVTASSALSTKSLEIHGGAIALNENINTTAGNAVGDVLLKASGDISLASAKSITTSGGDVILWSNSDNGTSNGSISLRNASSITTGSNSIPGGSIWLGGGSDGATWNGLSVGFGYAVPGTVFTPSSGGSNLSGGIYLEGSSINSFGGHIKLAADASNSTFGLLTYAVNSIDAKAGKIELDANATNAAAANASGLLCGIHDISIASIMNLTSSASDVAITISGVGRGTGDAVALSGTLNVLSTGTGEISINGNAFGSGRSIVAGNYYSGILNAFASSGKISLNGGAKAVQVAVQAVQGTTVGPSKINIGKGGTILNSSSDVFITADNIAVAASGIAVNSSGKVTIESNAASFVSTLTFPITNLSLSNDISGLTLGKSTNTANVTFANATSIAGPITAYGGTITLDANLTTTNNGAISLYSDNALGGLNTARTLTAASAFKYIPRGTTFSADVTYPITNLTATSSGLTIGKTTNDKDITINQDVTGGAGIELYGNNVNINSNLKTTLSGAMYLKGITTIAAGKYIESNGDFTHDGNMTFKSDATGTAAFGSLGGSFTTVNGTSTVERFIPAKRAWRLLTAPLKWLSNTTIPANWQGVNGEGLLLFSPANYQSQAMIGYTLGGVMPNIWKYNNGWQTVPNLTNENLFTSTGTKGYLVFATGPSNSNNIVSGAAATTLKPQGQLITGEVLNSIIGDQYNLVPNPYASALNTEAMVQGNSGAKVWMVDPSLGTVGGYFTYDGTNWVPTTPSSTDKNIQSGQAFFVRTLNNSTFTISESNKILGSSTTWFSRTLDTSADKIRVLLYKQNNSQWQLADGILAVNSASGNNDVDDTDTGKMSNFNENLMFINGTSNLAIEYRGLPTASTIQPMRLTGTTVQSYQLRVIAENYSNSNLQPYIEDTQTGTLTSIPTDGSEVILPFTGVVSSTTNPDSRFRIVYPNTLNSNDPSAFAVGVYPNPVNDGNFMILLKNSETLAKYTLTNLLGQQVQAGKLDLISNSISVATLQKGIYLLQVTQEGKNFKTKLIVK